MLHFLYSSTTLWGLLNHVTSGSHLPVCLRCEYQSPSVIYFVKHIYELCEAYSAFRFLFFYLHSSEANKGSNCESQALLFMSDIVFKISALLKILYHYIIIMSVNYLAGTGTIINTTNMEKLLHLVPWLKMPGEEVREKRTRERHFQTKVFLRTFDRLK